MNVSAMGDRPSLADILVYRPAIGPELASRLHLGEQEVHHVRLVGKAVEHDRIGELARAFLLGHDEGGSFEVRLVHLHDTLQNMLFSGQMLPEGGIPASHCSLGQACQCACLQDGLPHRPAPEERPPLLERQLQIREPGMREEREPTAARDAPVPVFIPQDSAASAEWTEYVFAEQRAPQELLDLHV